jgi:hypothetical protein
MNSLWGSLLGLIVIAIAVVLVFNLLQGRQLRLRDAWRERLARPGVEGNPPAADTDEPPGPAGVDAGRRPVVTERTEPTLEPSDAAALPNPAGAPIEPSLGPAPPAAAGSGPVGPRGAVLDVRLDCVVTFEPGVPVAVDRLLSVASTLRRAGSKPIVIETHAGDGRWSPPRAADGIAQAVRAGVLLANRHGPLNAMEFSEFGQAVQILARGIGAPAPELPEMAAVLEHARQLDEACARLDAVIGLTVQTPTALSPAELAVLAVGLDLDERGNNRFTRVGPDGDALFSLSLGERAQQLTLLLDLPRAPAAARPWEGMVECAERCAARTGGRVVDDAGRPFSSAAAAEVARELAARYAALGTAGLDAGSTAALRVFN